MGIPEGIPMGITLVALKNCLRVFFEFFQIAHKNSLSRTVFFRFEKKTACLRVVFQAFSQGPFSNSFLQFFNSLFRKQFFQLTPIGTPFGVRGPHLVSGGAPEPQNSFFYVFQRCLNVFSEGAAVGGFAGR